MNASSTSLLDRLPDPILLISRTGETLHANRATHELASSCNVRPGLDDLFGQAVQALLADARRAGSAGAVIPLASQPHRMYRVALNSSRQDGSLVAQLTEMTQEIAWRRDLSLRNRELTVLNDIGAALSAEVELEALCERIYEQTARIMDTSNFYIALYDREANTVRFPIYVEGRVVRREALARPYTNGMTEYVLHTRQPLLLNGDVDAQARSFGIEPMGRAGRSFLAVPMLSDGEAIGAIAILDHDHANTFQPHDLEVFTIIAGQAAASVKNARLFAATRRTFLELSETQHRQIETERLRGVTETVGALNHEVNNPLAAIAGNAQLLLRGSEPMSAEMRTKLERILEAARRIQQVTSKMTSLIQANSRPYPGQAQILDVGRSVAREEPPSHSTETPRISVGE